MTAIKWRISTDTPRTLRGVVVVSVMVTVLRRYYKLMKDNLFSSWNQNEFIYFHLSNTLKDRIRENECKRMLFLQINSNHLSIRNWELNIWIITHCRRRRSWSHLNPRTWIPNIFKFVINFSWFLLFIIILCIYGFTLKNTPVFNIPTVWILLSAPA